MKVSELGGEIALIKRIAKKPRRKSVLVGIGDDAAVIRVEGKKLLLTIDSLVENDHFSLKWFSPKQVGKKAIEANVSDIAVMNGKPQYALVGLSLPRGIDVEFVEELYKGLHAAAAKYNIDIVGGNTTHGKQIIIDIAMLGFAVGKTPLRANAKPGDQIIVSGPLGASAAGLKLLQKNKPGFHAVKKKHLEPKAQLKKALALAKYSNAMEDCSDGLASEVKNICMASNCSAIIEWEKIPVSNQTKKAAEALGKNAQELALFGGEDFEIIATVPKKHLKKVNGFVVGEILKKPKGTVYLKKAHTKKPLKKTGYDHFLS